MNVYEEKLERRRDRLLERATKHRHISEASFRRVHQICDGIPFGQPILVGHHSERHARADQDRIHNGMRKGIDEEKYAKELQHRADTLGTHGVSSDDPEAVVKLKKQLDKAEKVQARIKAANKIVRKFKGDEHNGKLALEGLGLTAGSATRCFVPDFCGRLGFPDYAITNNGANIRRLKTRIEELSKHNDREAKETEYEGFKIVENPDNNRIQIVFPGKPSAEIREVCKRNGFHFSYEESAWQRHLNNGGIWAAKNVAETLLKRQCDKPTEVQS